MDDVKDEAFTIYFTRDSFCFADDVHAPHFGVYQWERGNASMEMFRLLQDYFYLGLPAFHWRGYAGGRRMVDVWMRRKDKTYISIEYSLQDNWKEMLEEHRSVWFDNEMLGGNKLPEEIERRHSLEEVEALYQKYGRYCTNKPWENPHS